jgi:hypothetical protein
MKSHFLYRQDAFYYRYPSSTPGLFYQLRRTIAISSSGQLQPYFNSIAHQFLYFEQY